MSMLVDLERTCEAYDLLNLHILNEIKRYPALIEDLIAKGQKLQACIKQTVVALSGFIGSMQCLADSASKSRGSTKDFGTHLTMLSRRHRSVEEDLSVLADVIDKSFVGLLRSRNATYRKEGELLSKDYQRTCLRAKTELRKLMPSKKDKKKNRTSTVDDLIGPELREGYHRYEEFLRLSLQEIMQMERRNMCAVYSCMRPCVECELKIFRQHDGIVKIATELDKVCENPLVLPPSSIHAINDIKGVNLETVFKPSASTNINNHSPATSPTTPDLRNGCRKLSMTSISSSSSSDSTTSQIVASIDSGFHSQSEHVGQLGDFSGSDSSDLSAPRISERVIPPAKPMRRGSMKSDDFTVLKQFRDDAMLKRNTIAWPPQADGNLIPSSSTSDVEANTPIGLVKKSIDVLEFNSHQSRSVSGGASTLRRSKSAVTDRQVDTAAIRVFSSHMPGKQLSPVRVDARVDDPWVPQKSNIIHSSESQNSSTDTLDECLNVPPAFREKRAASASPERRTTQPSQPPPPVREVRFSGIVSCKEESSSSDSDNDISLQSFSARRASIAMRFGVKPPEEKVAENTADNEAISPALVEARRSLRKTGHL